MDIPIPDPHPAGHESARPKSLFIVSEPFPMTTRELKISKNFVMCFTPENIKSINLCLKNSGNGKAYFTIVTTCELWTFAPPKREKLSSDEEYENYLEFFELVEAANPLAIAKLAELYVNVAGKLTMVEETVDGKTIGILKYVKNPLDNLRGDKNGQK